MGNEAYLKMTELDSLTCAPHLQMIKAALPYIHIPEQRFFSLMVKCQELERTIRLFEQRNGETVGICSFSEEESPSPTDMLNAMKPYGTPQEQDMIDLMINFMQASRLSKSYRESQEAGAQGQAKKPSFPLEQLKTILPPEQQSRLETMQLMMQALQQPPQTAKQ